jgi:hypothetical protein
MKTILTIALFMGFIACQEATSDESYSAEANKITVAELKAAKLDEETVNQILIGYLTIKDELVKTNSKSVAFAAEKFLFNFEENENEFIEKLLLEVRLIAKSDNIEQQRIYFQGLSINAHLFAKNVDSKNLTIYQQFCPMAFENKGAYWISDKEEVYNPYFGDKMLRCGRVTEVIE